MMSETIGEIATALAKAQGQIDAATKGSTNPAFRSKYADLNALRDAIREPLAVNDLSIAQFARTTDGRVMVQTMLMHKSGEFISEVLQMRAFAQDGSSTFFGGGSGVVHQWGHVHRGADGHGQSTGF